MINLYNIDNYMLKSIIKKTNNKKTKKIKINIKIIQLLKQDKD